MKKKCAALLSVIMIFIMGFSVSAAEGQNYQQVKTLNEYHYFRDISLSSNHTGWAYTECPTGLTATRKEKYNP